MEKLYKDEYVSNIDYDIFREELCKGTINLDINDKKKYLCYQHAIIKFLETSRPNTMVFKKLAKFYEDFYKYPYLFANSPLLNESVIEKYADQLEKSKIKRTIESYYNPNVVTRLTDEFFRRDLNEEEKNKFYSSLIKDMRTANIYDVKKIVNKLVTNDKSIDTLSDIELQFIAQYAAMYGNKNVDVLITDEHPSIRSVDANGLITINRYSKDIENIEDLVYASCYASRFSRAASLVGKDVVQQYELAVHSLFNKYLNEEDYILYNKEYIYSSLYRYAIDKGYFDAQIILSTLGKEDLADELLKDKMKDNIIHNNNIYQKDSSSKPLMLKKEEEMNMGEFPASSFITKHLDDIILKHPDELKRYPVLNRFYYEHGKRKSFNEIFETYVNDSNPSSCLYGNFLSRGINDGNLSKLRLPEDNDIAYRYIDSLSGLFHDKMMVLFMYLKSSNESNYEELGYSILYQINQLANILNYILENIDKVIDVTKEKGRINQNCLLYKFLLDFKNLDYSLITNEGILNNHYVMYALVQLEVLKVELNNIFNKAFITERLNDLTEEERNKVLELPNGKKLTLSEFLYQEVLPNTNSKLEYEVDGVTIYITSLIDCYRNKDSKNKKH